jgi:hypothetical protein
VNQPPEHRTLPWLAASDEVLLRIQKQLEHLVSLRLLECSPFRLLTVGT